ncbi:hypothetical protein JL720_7314 [Aureococcus anophagefferens]|nr:hypothetical protein JL720_7314 [Aureococcus anophagefferens]
MRAPIALQLLGLLAAYAGAETHATPATPATPATFLHPLIETNNRSAPLLVPLARRPAPWNRTSAPEPRDWLAQLVRQTQQLYARREAYAAGVARFLRSVVAAFFPRDAAGTARGRGDAGARGADCAAVRRRPIAAGAQRHGEALRRRRGARRLRCALRYATTANGAVLGALRFGSACVKPSDESSGGAPFADADLLAVVDAVCDASSVVRALDLAGVDRSRKRVIQALFNISVDASRLTPGCCARALGHALHAAGGGKGLSYLAVVGAPLGPAGADRLAKAFRPSLAALRVAGCGIGDEGAARLLHALRKPGAPRLERLDVGGNGLGPQAVRRFKRLGAATCPWRRARGAEAEGRGAGQLRRPRGRLRGPARRGPRRVPRLRLVPRVRGEAARVGRALRDGARRLRPGPRGLLRRVRGDAPARGVLRRGFGAAPPGPRARPPAPPPRGAPPPPRRARPLRARAASRGDALPFAAFLDLDPRATARVRAAGLAAAAAAALHASRRADPDPPVLRVGKYVPVETLALLAVGSYAAAVAALPLRRALGDRAFKTIAAGALANVAAAIVHVAAGYGHVAAHGFSLLGAALYALVVLKSLVWHFLPAPPPPDPRP